MSKLDPREQQPTHSEPELDIDEGADALETRDEAFDAQRGDAPKRRDEDIISLDPGD